MDLKYDFLNGDIILDEWGLEPEIVAYPADYEQSIAITVHTAEQTMELIGLETKREIRLGLIKLGKLIVSEHPNIVPGSLKLGYNNSKFTITCSVKINDQIFPLFLERNFGTDT
ncbi:MAG: hypothetical protein JKX96_04305 [Acinetobacter sp.]|nr:hypothetical protein [Acinetobacter sp.]